MGPIVSVSGERVQCRVGDVDRRMRTFVRRLILEVAIKACSFVVSMGTEVKKLLFLLKTISREYSKSNKSSNQKISVKRWKKHLWRLMRKYRRKSTPRILVLRHVLCFLPQRPFIVQMPVIVELYSHVVTTLSH